VCVLAQLEGQGGVALAAAAHNHAVAYVRADNAVCCAVLGCIACRIVLAQLSGLLCLRNRKACLTVH
jgi:hypothetical protein